MPHDDAKLAASISLIYQRGPQPDSRWRHRNGTVYEVVTTEIHSETLEPMVSYREVAGDQPTITWTRPLEMFTDGRFTEVT